MNEKQKKHFLKFKEMAKPFGYVKLKIFRHGKLWRVEEGPNVWTSQGLAHTLKVQGAVGSAGPVSHMELGCGGCGLTPPISSFYTPVAFTAGDTDLRDTISLLVAVEPSPTIVEPPSGPPYTITYEAFLSSSSTSNGDFSFTPRVVNEIALKSTDGVVIALRAFRSIPFDPADAMSIQAQWTLGLT